MLNRTKPYNIKIFLLVTKHALKAAEVSLSEMLTRAEPQGQGQGQGQGLIPRSRTRTDPKSTRITWTDPQGRGSRTLADLSQIEQNKGNPKKPFQIQSQNYNAIKTSDLI